MELSVSPSERARKAHARVLQALQGPGTQRSLAHALGTSEATVSRIKTEKLEDTLVLLYQLGFKVVSADKVCVDAQALEFMRQAALRMLATQEAAARLWEDE
ncbi:hypothetical protein MOJ79_16985 [Calidifontimicrobium sp. SYSU G02091]|uniref:hypothetical protein n=1 Tax=Calidifontimicrobium sp. SYSU G02091 TaxID=2926421 RepID=UPI001F52C049|nr:hypothetical protein [Calidifontimicrobium sp. SYSU G02091]MCI1193528.1 hypothetical protein [Calidifontimicrobium sp. SYSU G02091]